jgi:hypothetical protein
MEQSPVVSKEEWQGAHEALLAKEKEDSPLGYPQTPPSERWRPHDADGAER